MSKRHVNRTPKRRERPGVGALPKDLYSYAEVRSLPPTGRPPKFTPETWTVTDEWPTPLPVSKAEIDLFEAWLGGLFDEFFKTIS
ncbi:hypothetical protein [Mesorhizobium sp. NPDC059025]|uniref:hypothetical protein n=1 Tax=unclassified Mesorhizobium TaxID=325217 RepID=UPI0036B555CF